MKYSILINRHVLFVFVVISLFGMACRNLPRDPEETLHRVQAGRLRVGLIENPPWVVRTAGEPAGADAVLVRSLAEEIGVTPEWKWGGEQQQMTALEHFELDLVVGGLTKDTPWKKSVGLTSPYYEDRISVGVPGSVPLPLKIKGMRIATRRGEPVAAYLEDKGAVALRVDDLSRAGGPVAAPDWQLEQLGLVISDVELRTEKHVMATPPGENGWIKRLDEFLQQRRLQVKALLQQEARQ